MKTKAIVIFLLATFFISGQILFFKLSSEHIDHVIKRNSDIAQRMIDENLSREDLKKSCNAVLYAQLHKYHGTQVKDHIMINIFTVILISLVPFAKTKEK